MNVVVDASPLIALSLIGQLPLLPQLFDKIIVPPLVYEEVAIQGVGQPGADELSAASWIQVQAPQLSYSLEPMLLGLDAGEIQVLLLAQEIDPDWVIIDERLGRRVAKAMGLRVKGSVGVLLTAFHADLLQKSEALVAVHQLVKEGIHISERVINWFEGELDEFE